MNTFIIAAIVASLIVVAAAIGLKLFDIGSDFSPIISKVSIPAAILLSLITVFLIAFPTMTEEKFDMGVFSAIVFCSMIALTALGKIASKIIDAIMARKKRKKKSKLPFFPLTLIDTLGGIVAGVAFAGFLFNGSLVYLSAMALALFLIMEKAAIVMRYEDDWSRKQIISNVAISLIVIPIVSALVTWLLGFNYTVAISVLAFGCGYLLYRTGYHLFFIAKSHKKS